MFSCTGLPAWPSAGVKASHIYMSLAVGQLSGGATKRFASGKGLGLVVIDVSAAETCLSAAGIESIRLGGDMALDPKLLVPDVSGMLTVCTMKPICKISGVLKAVERPDIDLRAEGCALLTRRDRPTVLWSSHWPILSLDSSERAICQPA